MWCFKVVFLAELFPPLISSGLFPDETAAIPIHFVHSSERLVFSVLCMRPAVGVQLRFLT